jgi:hypothetical protein
MYYIWSPGGPGGPNTGYYRYLTPFGPYLAYYPLMHKVVFMYNTYMRAVPISTLICTILLYYV